ncbi:hypothetical protein M569_14780 [Genlisea aurea]|uniref:Uncharacterized protein n=1 Tax=Genlisea aurea TaxID=192259 RepID=S8BZL4_9LAMI|nr:hypothetical protein M569_14780 [Genlisea aurea]
MVAYCGEEGSAVCFRPTSRSVRDPSRNRTEHFLCSSLSEEGKSSPASTLVVSTPAAAPSSRFPAMKRSAPLKHAGDEIEVIPAKSVGLNRVRWSPNKATEKWVCYGGAAGLLRCHQLHPSCFR